VALDRGCLRLSCDQRGQGCDRAEKFEFGHLLLQVVDPLCGLSDSQTCVRGPIFRNA
jgi:hypothetical protein